MVILLCYFIDIGVYLFKFARIVMNKYLDIKNKK